MMLKGIFGVGMEVLLSKFLAPEEEEEGLLAGK